MRLCSDRIVLIPPQQNCIEKRIKNNLNDNCMLVSSAYSTVKEWVAGREWHRSRERVEIWRINMPFWSPRAVVSELNVLQWHMRDIRAAQHDRQRSPVQCKNEDTSFSISAPLSTDRHTQTHTHTKTYRESSAHIDRVPHVHFSIRADRMLQFIRLHGKKNKTAGERNAVWYHD